MSTSQLLLNTMERQRMTAHPEIRGFYCQSLRVLDAFPDSGNLSV